MSARTHRKPIDPQTANSIVKMYLQGCDWSAIRERFGISQDCTRDVLKRAGVK
jgi:DNA invertase Pin-like site-specific DNA recombinase